VTPASLATFELVKPDFNVDQIVTGAVQTYIFRVTPSNEFESARGLVEIVLPPEVSIVPSGLCSAFSETDLVVLGCVLDTEKNSVLVSHN